MKDKTGRRTIDPNFNNLLNTNGTPLSPLGKLYASTPPLLEYDWSYSYKLPWRGVVRDEDAEEVGSKGAIFELLPRLGRSRIDSLSMYVYCSSE